MNIIADENIPFVHQAFSALGDVSTLSGRNLKHSDLKDCDCLLVRSVTQVNRELLEGTTVQFIASATIGTDHIDLEYLKANNIGFANAPGCNAESAAEYMINALFHLSQKRDFDPFRLTAGVIGHGNVGSRVKKKLDALGINTLVNDPPLQEAGDDSVNYVSLQSIIDECDFITCHVPLTKRGNHPTWHLFDAELLKELPNDTILFNASRGAVVDNQALSILLKQRHDLIVFLDCWEDEPSINQKLLQQVDLAAPHIAGYSYEGKLRGTQMILDAACSFFNIESDWCMQEHLPQKQVITVDSNPDESFWANLFNRHYSVEQDYQKLLALAKLESTQAAIEFDLLRKNYPQRFEYHQHQVQGIKDKKIAAQVKQLLFNIN